MRFLHGPCAVSDGAALSDHIRAGAALGHVAVDLIAHAVDEAEDINPALGQTEHIAVNSVSGDIIAVTLGAKDDRRPAAIVGGVFDLQQEVHQLLIVLRTGEGAEAADLCRDAGVIHQIPCVGRADLARPGVLFFLIEDFPDIIFNILVNVDLRQGEGFAAADDAEIAGRGDGLLCTGIDKVDDLFAVDVQNDSNVVAVGDRSDLDLMFLLEGPGAVLNRSALLDDVRAGAALGNAAVDLIAHAVDEAEQRDAVTRHTEHIAIHKIGRNIAAVTLGAKHEGRPSLAAGGIVDLQLKGKQFAVIVAAGKGGVAPELGRDALAVDQVPGAAVIALDRPLVFLILVEDLPQVVHAGSIQLRDDHGDLCGNALAVDGCGYADRRFARCHRGDQTFGADLGDRLVRDGIDDAVRHQGVAHFGEHGRGELLAGGAEAHADLAVHVFKAEFFQAVANDHRDFNHVQNVVGYHIDTQRGRSLGNALDNAGIADGRNGGIHHFIGDRQAAAGNGLVLAVRELHGNREGPVHVQTELVAEVGLDALGLTAAQSGIRTFQTGGVNDRLSRGGRRRRIIRLIPGHLNRVHRTKLALIRNNLDPAVLTIKRRCCVIPDIADIFRAVAEPRP